MSVLERFVRVRRFRVCASEYYDLAGVSFNMDVRRRYLAIADHYAALAETELLSDRLERKRRLEELSAARAKKKSVATQPHRPAQWTYHNGSSSVLFKARGMEYNGEFGCLLVQILQLPKLPHSWTCQCRHIQPVNPSFDNDKRDCTRSTTRS